MNKTRRIINEVAKTHRENIQRVKSPAEKIVDKMYHDDQFSRWLGIELVKVDKGYCILQMTVRKEMVNGFGNTHGGIMFSLADSALAFASNAYGRLSVALDCSVSFPVPVKIGDMLTATTNELIMTNKTATYFIEVTNQKNEKVAFFKGRYIERVRFGKYKGANSEWLRIYESLYTNICKLSIFERD